jgi:hypothetical protein
MRRVELGAGTTIHWDSAHGDEALFVERGELAIGSRSCPTGGALVIEARAAPKVGAVTATRLIQMGAREQRPRSDRSSEADRPAPIVHVVGARGTFEALEAGRETRFFADATCTGCRVWLLYTARDFAYESPVHSHSQDELIHVLRGEIRIGSLCVGAGSTVFVGADQPYRFRAGDDGFAFLNYRSDASQMTIRSTGERIIETGAANGMAPVSDMPSWRDAEPHRSEAPAIAVAERGRGTRGGRDREEE